MSKMSFSTKTGSLYKNPWPWPTVSLQKKQLKKQFVAVHDPTSFVVEISTGILDICLWAGAYVQRNIYIYM